LSLLFSLRTHKHLYAGAATEHEHKPIQVGRAIVTLVVATALVAWMSELLVGAVEETSRVLGLSEVFVGVIVVAVVGNAAEHSTAVMVAMKNHMDLAVKAAVGVVNLVAQDGESNWLEGALLLAVYVVLGLAFFFLP